MKTDAEIWGPELAAELAEADAQLIYRTLGEEIERAGMLARERGVAHVVVFRQGEYQAHVWHALETLGLDVDGAADPDGTTYVSECGELRKVEA